ncbi:MAG: hypothetical protein KGO49_07230 [Gammaproteobacteria bacterium]|nr:hypothetical protein [Gammaproteobacteria bacterium]
MEANRKMSFRVKVLGVSVATALLAACGGGGGSGTSNVNSTSISGKAVDFYLNGATVTFTDCGNVTATTDATGNFTTPQNCSNSAYTVTGGTDIGTGLAFKGLLKSSFNSQNQVSTIASPLTTLLAFNPNLNLQSLFGLTKDPRTTDPMTDAASLRAAEVVQALLNQVSTALQGAGATQQQAADAAAKALASVLASTNSTGSTAILTNAANIQSLINLAATNASVTLSSTTLATTIANQVGSVDTALSNIAIGATPADTLTALKTGGVTSVITTAATSSALTNYIQLSNVLLNGSQSESLAQVQASTTTPISVTGGLSDLQISMSGQGSYASSTQTVDAGFTYTTKGNTVSVVIKGVQLTFSGGTLTGATVPTGASYSFSVTGTSSASATMTNKTADNLLNNGKVDLSIPVFLSKLSGAASSVNTTALIPASGVTTTAALTIGSPSTNAAVSVGDGSGQPVSAVSVISGSTSVVGSGVNVSVN